MTLRRVYRFKLEPSQEQTHKLYQLSGARRFVYDWALDRRKEHFEATGKGLSVAALCLELTQLQEARSNALASGSGFSGVATSRQRFG